MTDRSTEHANTSMWGACTRSCVYVYNKKRQCQQCQEVVMSLEQVVVIINLVGGLVQELLHQVLVVGRQFAERAVERRMCLVHRMQNHCMVLVAFLFTETRPPRRETRSHFFSFAFAFVACVPVFSLG
jgi:hypothetical protein